MTGRDSIVEDLKTKLFGPGLGQPDETGSFENEVFEGRLRLAYLTGILFPKDQALEKENNDDQSGPSQGEDATQVDPDDPLNMASALLQSSLGISFCCKKNSSFEISISAAQYKPHTSNDSSSQVDVNNEGKNLKEKKNQSWKRVPLKTECFEVDLSQTVTNRKSRKVFEDIALFEPNIRELKSGLWLVTLSLRNNRQTTPQDKIENSSNTLYQVKLAAKCLTGKILKYPDSTFTPHNAEERELRIIYGERRPYAIGHGTSVDWHEESDNVCQEVFSEAMPSVYVWKPIFDKLEINNSTTEDPFEIDQTLQLSYLAKDELDQSKLISNLSKLVKYYKLWIENQKLIQVDQDYLEDKTSIISRMEKSAARIQEGVELLTNPTIFEVFKLANMAMLMSMCHADRIEGKNRSDKKEGPFELGDADTKQIDYLAQTDKKWRPFQLAFFLQVLPSLWNEDHEDRDLVDLIWFSTGGGKTEAYLFVSIFELIRRRYIYGDKGAGVGVINRYTYRFLSMDQFQRTSVAICALEKLRQSEHINNNYSIGNTPFTIGLFVGDKISPNSVISGDSSAKSKLINLYNEDIPRDKNPFPISSCPYCGTHLIPKRKRTRFEDNSADTALYGFEAKSESNFVTRCLDKSCDFHDTIPVNYVDTAIKKNPPSFMIGTIDKFAMVPWHSENGRLLGGLTKCEPPTLIIQDELHLISGPLGTLAGLYEAAFDTIISNNGQKKAAKVIASTATIRNAGAQCRRMYGKGSSIFPSPGIRDTDSFFSKLDVGNKSTARQYIGIMGQGLTSTVSVQWSIAALLQSIHELFNNGQLTPKEYDSYFTLLAFHNSIRELGRISNAANDEIPERTKVYATTIDSLRRTPYNVLELKSNSDTPIPQARQLLNTTLSEEKKGIDLAPCTNIISVGVDIPRLALMLINGQPKLSSEYIQASSRVGRSNVPGLIITCLSPTKPRDRSHYEAFRHYHESFYSFVEPTSVTPGSIPALDRALHACLVSVIRNTCQDLNGNQDAAKFDPSSSNVKHIVSEFEARLLKAYPNEQIERDRIKNKLSQVIGDWKKWANNNTPLVYKMGKNDPKNALLFPFSGNKKLVGWPTLESMRSVDGEINLE